MGRTVRKLGRDLLVLGGVAVLGVIVNNWSGVVEAVNGALPGHEGLNEVYLAGAFALVMAAYRALRAAAGKDPDNG